VNSQPFAIVDLPGCSITENRTKYVCNWDFAVASIVASTLAPLFSIAFEDSRSSEICISSRSSPNGSGNKKELYTSFARGCGNRDSLESWNHRVASGLPRIATTLDLPPGSNSMHKLIDAPVWDVP
jgi:hypothetical protein